MIDRKNKIYFLFFPMLHLGSSSASSNPATGHQLVGADGKPVVIFSNLVVPRHELLAHRAEAGAHALFHGIHDSGQAKFSEEEHCKVQFYKRANSDTGKSLQ
jgi:hypothetical protein